MTEAAAGSTSAAAQYAPQTQLATVVSAQIGKLQRAYLERRQGSAANLARLRRAVDRAPGTVPEVWELTLKDVPIPRGYDSPQPARSEYAAHLAITLYALHQQSQSAGMHQPGIGLGTAARRLADKTEAIEAVTRRFQAIGTASEFSEVAYHLRGLVSQFRSAGIALDYAKLADDLYALQDVNRAGDVRLRWGRQFFRTTRPEADQTDTTDPNGASE